MGLMGQYLDTMPDVDRERVLTQEMWPGSYFVVRGEGPRIGPCLVGTAEVEHASGFTFRADKFARDGHTVVHRYDVLCKRFGTARANALIRDRLLTGKRTTREAVLTIAALPVGQG